MNGLPSSMYCFAMHMSLREVPPGATADLIQAAIDRPCPETVGAVLVAGFGTEWIKRLEHSLIEIGVAASEGVTCP